jgi:hypothetical protein
LPVSWTRFFPGFIQRWRHDYWVPANRCTEYQLLDWPAQLWPTPKSVERNDGNRLCEVKQSHYRLYRSSLECILRWSDGQELKEILLQKRGGRKPADSILAMLMNSTAFVVSGASQNQSKFKPITGKRKIIESFDKKKTVNDLLFPRRADLLV